MIHKGGHAVGERGCSPTRLGISRWMQTLLCARQAFREMQRNEMALEVTPNQDSALNSEIASRTETWLMSSPDPNAHPTEFVEHGSSATDSERPSYSSDKGISPHGEVHFLSFPGHNSPDSLSQSTNMAFPNDQRSRCGTHKARRSSHNDNRQPGQLGFEVSETGAAERPLQCRKQMIDNHLKHQEDECLLMIKGIETLKKQLKKEMDSLQRALGRAYKEKEENESLLRFHQVLQSSNDLESVVRVVKEKTLAEVPEDLQVMVNDCLETRHGLRNKACIVCMENFTAEDLLEVSKSDRCRHAIYPCGHAVLCGGCAKRIWSTTRKCPMCRTEMQKKPTLFKPGRWQITHGS